MIKSTSHMWLLFSVLGSGCVSPPPPPELPLGWFFETRDCMDVVFDRRTEDGLRLTAPIKEALEKGCVQPILVEFLDDGKRLTMIDSTEFNKGRYGISASPVPRPTSQLDALQTIRGAAQTPPGIPGVDANASFAFSARIRLQDKHGDQWKLSYRITPHELTKLGSNMMLLFSGLVMIPDEASVDVTRNQSGGVNVASMAQLDVLRGFVHQQRFDDRPVLRACVDPAAYEKVVSQPRKIWTDAPGDTPTTGVVDAFQLRVAIDGTTKRLVTDYANHLRAEGVIFDCGAPAVSDSVSCR